MNLRKTSSRQRLARLAELNWTLAGCGQGMPQAMKPSQIERQNPIL